jgi:hypothetical protein
MQRRRTDEVRRPVTRVITRVSQADHAIRPSAPPIGDKSKFWKEDFESFSPGTVCTICLSQIMDNPSMCVGQSACCKSWYHKDCTAMYWASAGEVKCPNCRHEVV